MQHTDQLVPGCRRAAEPAVIACARMCHPQGTFLVRPSLSLAGAMVLSVVVNGAVKHMALDGNQLDTRSLEVRARAQLLLPGAAPMHADRATCRACMQICKTPDGSRCLSHMLHL